MNDAERIKARNEGIKRYLEMLNGITYEEWVRLSAIVSRSFDLEKEKLNRDIQLPDKEVLGDTIRSLFG